MSPSPILSLLVAASLGAALIAAPQGEVGQDPAAATAPAPATEPDPAYDALHAHLAHRPADVAAALAKIPSPAARARLQAAFCPVDQRPVAMLVVAQRFPEDPEADLALLAGAAAVVVTMGRGEAASEAMQWLDRIDEDRYSNPRAKQALLPVVNALHGAIARRRAAGGDGKVLDEAAAMLAVACVSRPKLEPVWIARDDRFRVPEGLGEPIEIAFHRRAPGSIGFTCYHGDRLRWDELLGLGAPLHATTFEPRREATSPEVPYGHYLCAVRSQATPWWGVVPVEVSDLVAVAVRDEQTLVLATWSGPQPVPAQFELEGWHGLQRGEVDGRGAVIALDESLCTPDASCLLRLASEFGPARLHSRGPSSNPLAGEERWLVHTMVERPVVRPGETMRGRLVLRETTRTGEGRARVPTTRAAADRGVRVRLPFGAAGEAVAVGRTDAQGLLAFEVAVPEVAQPTGGVAVLVDVLPQGAEEEVVELDGGRPFAIAPFARAAATIACEGPEVLPGRGEAVEVAAVVRYASGAPVAGQRVMAVCAGTETALRTGADGRASLRIDLAAWRAWRAGATSPEAREPDLRVLFRTLGPDGTSQQGEHVVLATKPERARAVESPRRWSRDSTRIDVEPAVVGRATRLVLRGAAGARAMLVVGRSRNARVFPVHFDQDGRAAQTVEVLRCDWPQLDVALVDRDGTEEDFATVSLGPVVAAVVEVAATVAPGGELAAHVRSGRPGALVTLAVVDERLYAIEADRTREPTGALRPHAPFADWARFVRATRADPADLLADLLVAGRVPPLDLLTFVGGGAGAGGPAAGAGNLAPPVRADFRAVAHFETVCADASGLATFRVRMPSDLTTWRLTAAVVDANGEGALARASTSTCVPWSVEPVLPRGVREGDAFDLPLVVAHAAEAAGKQKAEGEGAKAAANDRVALHANAVGTGLEFAKTMVATEVVAGRSQLVTLPVRAVGSGEATLGLELRGTELQGTRVLDRSVRPVAVERDAVARPVVAAQRGEGTVRIGLPEGASPEEELVVDVMLGDAAVWRRLERDLAVYPYGCAEQTLAKLLPYFAAARAAKRRQLAVPAMDQDFRKRLRAGLGRLRQLRAGPSQFAFWPGGEADAEISVLVRHGLAVLREAGVDLAAERLDVAGAFVVPVPLANGADEPAQHAFALAVEHAAASLRLAPEASRARELMAVALPARADEPMAPRCPAPGLAAGAIARLGLALLAAGERDGARACLRHLDRRGPAGLGVVAHAGDDPLAVAAMHFELRLALDEDAAAVQRALADLVLQCTSGGTTYGQACASAALALAVSPTARESADVVVEVAGQRREATLRPERPELGRMRFPRGGEVVVRGPAGVSLLVRVTGLRTQRGSDHAAWTAPIRVERALHALPGALDDASLARAMRQPLAPAAGAAAGAGDDAATGPEPQLPLADGKLPAGRPVLLVVRATSPTALSHVVIECPLPCGFEPVGDVRGLERFDAHVAFVANLAAGVRYERRLVLVPTTVGRFSWPPVVAAPMYASGLDGGTAGAFVEVAAPVVGKEPTHGDWQAPAAPPTPRLREVPTDRIGPPAADDEDPLAVLFACWEREREFQTVVPELAAQTTRALGFDRESAEPSEQIVALQRWIEASAAAARHRAGRPGLAPRAWAAQFDAWLRDLQLVALLELVRRPVPSDQDDAASEITAAYRALEYVEDPHEREFLRIGLLRRAAAAAPAEVEGLLVQLPENLELADNWPGLPELLVSLLVHGDEDVRRAAFDRLPRAVRSTLPLAVTLRAYGTSWDEAFVREWVRSERWAAEFEQVLHDPDLVQENREVLLACVPAEWWLRLPLSVIERLAEVAVPFATSDMWSVPQLGTIAARGFATDDELAQAFVRTADDDVRDVLARAMEQRGRRAIGAPVRADDASFSLWQQALAVPPADVARSIEMLRGLCTADGELPPQHPECAVGRFLCARLTARGTPEEVYAIARALQRGDWAVAWQRFDAGQRVQLVDRFRHHLPDCFAPATEVEAEAIWRFLQRGGHVDAMPGLVATMPGARCARRHVEARDGGPRAAELRTAFAEALDYDEATLQPAVDDAASVLCDSLQRWGRAAELTPHERTALARLRRHLGAAPPLR